MPKFVVRNGKVGRHEGSGRTLKVYRVGDVIELPAATAVRLGSKVEPYTRQAAVALATSSMSGKKPSADAPPETPDPDPSGGSDQKPPEPGQQKPGGEEPGGGEKSAGGKDKGGKK